MKPIAVGGGLATIVGAGLGTSGSFLPINEQLAPALIHQSSRALRV
ncbi:hypothetical protein [Coleofasciculus sp. F4-SAH-05]